MPRVRIADKRVWVDDESRALLHGEVHYWRLSPARWPAALRAIRELGLDIVSSYVPWEFHELEPGLFDFAGQTDPLRDLVGFIEQVKAAGLWLVLRPGPYIYAEWPNSGLPERIVRFHRLHPEFKREAERYMAAASQVVVRYLATRGGPIVLVQADNEPDPWPDIYAAQLGLADTPGPFQDFLRERYADVDSLNDAWSTHLGRFEEARAVLAPLRPEDAPRYLDVVRFYHAHTAEIVRWTADCYRQLGIDVPLYANAYSGFGVQHWPQMERAVEVVGPDVYPTAELREDPVEHRRMLERLRFTRTYSPLPYIPEFEAGIWHGWHTRIGTLPAEHYRLIGVSALLAGVAGWGWYMLVNRDNWYMSPIDELGLLRPDLAGEFASIVRVFREIDPPALEKVTDTAVAVDVLQLGARLGGPPGEAVLEALYAADVDFECFDVATGQIAKPLVLYAGADWLARAAQERLLAYVENGGTLVAFQDLPLRDDAFRPLNVLELQVPTGVLRAAYPQQISLQLGAEQVTCSSPTFGWYAEVPGEPIHARRIPDAVVLQQGMRAHVEVPVGERYIVGYRQARGRGSIVVVSLVPSSAVVVALHRWLGVPIACRAADGPVTTALFRRPDGRRFLLATNTGAEARTSQVTLSESADRARDLFSGESWPVAGPLQLNLRRKSGTVIEISDPLRRSAPPAQRTARG